MTGVINFEIQTNVLNIVLNNPEKHNSLTASMVEEFIIYLDNLPTNIKTIVMRGEGKSFCAGADLDLVTSDLQYIKNLETLVKKLERVKIPVIAHLTGATIGAGVQLACCADIRIMQTGSFISIPAVKIGVGLDSWTIKKLVSLLGDSMSRFLLYTGGRVTAARCLELGFAAEMGDYTKVRELADSITKLSEAVLEHYKLILGVNNLREIESTSEIFSLLKTWNQINN